MPANPSATSKSTFASPAPASIVGLDTHVGFVVNDGESLAFIHSTYYRPPKTVVAEATDSVNPLRDSNYRVVGKILDDTMMRKWILGGSFALNHTFRTCMNNSVDQTQAAQIVTHSS